MTSVIRFSLKSAILSNVLILLVSACAQAQETKYSPNSVNTNALSNSSVLDDSQALAAQASQAIQREITVTARVNKILPEDVKGLPHQRFLIELSNGSTVLIAHDLKYAPSVPIKPADVVCIHGEYIWNRLGGLIHWTHRSNTPKHESGWIDFNGLRYQ